MASCQSLTTMIAPWFSHDAVAIFCRGSLGNVFSTASATISAKEVSSVMRIDCAASSCSAWASKSMATQSGLLCLSANINISEGPAMESIPTFPKTCLLAVAT